MAAAVRVHDRRGGGRRCEQELMARAGNPWPGLGWQAWSLGLEASCVIGLRTLLIAAGGEAARAEARRMVSEKLDAAAALQVLTMTGGLGFTAAGATAKTLDHYRRRVSANRRRLTNG